MPLYYSITVPGLSVKRDFTAARERLLADFPDVHEVVATTAAATLLVLYSGQEDPDAWVQTLRELVTGHRVTAASGPLSPRAGSWEGDDSAA
jgi:putative intracellular protease/amidase